LLACVMAVGLAMASLAAATAAIPACSLGDDAPTVSEQSASIDIVAAYAHEAGQNDCMPDAVLIAAAELAPPLVKQYQNPHPAVAPEGVSAPAAHRPPRCRLIPFTPTISL
jgi:hypothetical protein